MRILIALSLLLAAASFFPVGADAGPIVSSHCSGGPAGSSFCVTPVGPCSLVSGQVWMDEIQYTYNDLHCVVPVVGDCGAYHDGLGRTDVDCGPV